MIAALQTILAACKKNGIRAASALRNARLCRPRHRLGLRHDHRRRRQPLSGRRSGAAVAGFRKLTDGITGKTEKGGY